MNTQAKQVEDKLEVKRYPIQYAASAYLFPTDARIHDVHFSDEHITLALMDGRLLSIPLWWIPPLYNASPQDRERYKINRNRTMLIWDPDEGAINDELRVSDYLMG